MKDTKEIVLFFKPNVKFSSVVVAQEIINRFEFIGEPVIMPENQNAQVPLILFNSNKEFQMQITRTTVNLLVNHVHFSKLSEIIFDIVDIFDDFDAKFYRIGYVSSIFLSPKHIDVAKRKYLNMESLDDMKDFNFSFYRKLVCEDELTINCWERIITDEHNFKELLVQFDFNTLTSEEFEFEMKYIKEFIKVTDKYIDDGLNF